MKSLAHIKTQYGLTLLEMLVTIVLVAILAGLAVPSFQSSIENNRIGAQQGKLSSALQLARSEAIGRGRSVTLCPSNDQSTCSGSWDDGWIIFVDDNADRTLNAGTDTLLRAETNHLGNYPTSLIGPASNSFQFTSEGRAAERGTFQSCGPSGRASDARATVIEFSGGSREATDSNADGIRETHTGANLTC